MNGELSKSFKKMETLDFGKPPPLLDLGKLKKKKKKKK